MNPASPGLTFAQMRQHMAPEFPGPNAKETICIGCGGPFLQWVGQHFARCPACAAEESAESILSMQMKAGPKYEKVVRGQFRYWAAEAARLGLTPETGSPSAPEVQSP